MRYDEQFDRCRNLVAAVMRMAVADYYDELRRERRRLIALRRPINLLDLHDHVLRRTEVGGWFTAPEGNFFSFRGACELLELDPERLLMGLRKRETMQQLKDVLSKLERSAAA